MSIETGSRTIKRVIEVEVVEAVVTASDQPWTKVRIPERETWVEFWVESDRVLSLITETFQGHPSDPIYGKKQRRLVSAWEPAE